MSVQKIDVDQGRAPWMPFWGADFYASTVGWTLQERGAYQFLLWNAWASDGLPPDENRIFRLDPDISKMWPLLSEKFPIAEDGKRRNPRQEKIRFDMKNTANLKREKAQAAANKRWHNPQSSNANAYADALPTHMPMQCHTDTYTKTDTQSEAESKTQKLKHTLIGFAAEQDIQPPRKKPASSISDDDCETVWQIFPRRVGKKKAFILIRKAAAELADIYDQDDPAAGILVLCERVQKFADDSRNADPKFIAHPTTWLQQGRYLDPQEAL